MIELGNYDEFLNKYYEAIDNSVVENLFNTHSLTNQNHRYELQLVSGIKKQLFFETLSDVEKLCFRKRELELKKAYREIYSDLVIAYEENVLVLTSLILKVLDNCKCDFLSFSFDDKIASDDLNFARLCTILKIELICLNRHMKLENGGHVLFDAIAKPVFDDLKESFFMRNIV